MSKERSCTKTIQDLCSQAGAMQLVSWFQEVLPGLFPRAEPRGRWEGYFSDSLLSFVNHFLREHGSSGNADQNKNSMD